MPLLRQVAGWGRLTAWGGVRKVRHRQRQLCDGQDGSLLETPLGLIVICPLFTVNLQEAMVPWSGCSHCPQRSEVEARLHRQ